MTGGSRHRPRRLKGAAVIAGLLVVGGCSTPTADAATTVRIPATDRLLAFGPTPAGPTVLSAAGVVSVAGDGAPAVTAGAPTGTVAADVPAGGSIDRDGRPWLVLPNGVPVSSVSGPHPAGSQIAAMYGPVSVGGTSLLRKVDPWAVAVEDGDRVLVGTYTDQGSTFWHAENSVVRAVTATGSTEVAGHEGDPSLPAVSSLKPGASAPATSVRLERVQSVVPLSSSSFLLLMNAPTDPQDATRSRLQAARVDGSTLTRIALPTMCAGQDVVRGVRAGDTLVVLSVPGALGQECGSSSSDWFRLNLPSGQVTSLGSGIGLAYLDGATLVSATRDSVSSDTVTMRWTATAGR